MHSSILTGREKPLEKTLGIIIALYITLLPFNIGPTAWTVFSLTIIFLSFSLWSRQKSENSIKDLLKSPIFFTVFFVNFFALISIAFSPDPAYSVRVFLSEFLLNSALFISLLLFCETEKKCRVKWKEGLKTANMIFLLFYLGLMTQWILFPSHPLLIKQEAIPILHDTGDLIFNFGNSCRLFHGIHHTSLFLALMIAFWSALSDNKSMWKNLCFLIFDFIALVTTTRRAATLASVTVLICSINRGKKAGRLLLLTVIFLSIIFSVIVVSSSYKYFMRENWQLILKGNIEKARKLGGSIPLRISTYREFALEISQHPFTPMGIGKKLIKEYHRDLVKNAGLQHGHNTFLNFAFYMGTQGALALIAFIAVQASLFWKTFRDSDSRDDKQLMLVAMTFLIIFWGTNIFTDGFRHGSATLYWLFTAIPTGRALRNMSMKKRHL